MKNYRKALWFLGLIIIGAVTLSSCEDDFTENQEKEENISSAAGERLQEWVFYLNPEDVVQLNIYENHLYAKVDVDPVYDVGFKNNSWYEYQLTDSIMSIKRINADIFAEPQVLLVRNCSDTSITLGRQGWIPAIETFISSYHFDIKAAQ